MAIHLAHAVLLKNPEHLFKALREWIMEQFAALDPEDLPLTGRPHFPGKAICFVENDDIAGSVILPKLLEPAELWGLDGKSRLLPDLPDYRASKGLPRLYMAPGKVTPGQPGSSRSCTRIFPSRS